MTYGLQPCQKVKELSSSSSSSSTERANGDGRLRFAGEALQDNCSSSDPVERNATGPLSRGGGAEGGLCDLEELWRKIQVQRCCSRYQ